MTLAAGDLTAFATAKGYVEPLPSDQILSGLITRVSMMIRGYINRPFILPRTYTEVYNGFGTNALVLYNFPVVGSSLNSLVVSGATIGLAPVPTDQNAMNTSPPLTAPFGYRLAPWNGVPPGNNQNIELVGGIFPMGNQNVVVNYTAGYGVVDEPATVPATPGPYTVTPLAPWGIWASDTGVKLADGTALTLSATNVPGPGEYYPPQPNGATPTSVYTFNAAQQGAGVLLSYGYVPADLEQVALEVIAERSSYRRRAGIRSQVLANQETIVFDLNASGLTGWARTALQTYCNVLPLPTGANV